MSYGTAAGWVPTERTHPILWMMFLGGVVITVGFFAVIWGIFVGLVGVTLTIVSLGVILAMDLGASVWFAQLLRPSAIRVSDEGIEVRRLWGPTIPLDVTELRVQRRPPAGFGYVGSRTPPRYGFVLSPQQFAAVVTRFPLAVDGTEPPLR